MFAAGIRKRRIQGMKSSRWRWHLDEVFERTNGKQHYLWRAVEHEGEVLESYVTKRRDKKEALKFLTKAMRKHGNPNSIVTDKLRSYCAVLKDLGGAERQETGRWINIRAQNRTYLFDEGRGRCFVSGACEICIHSRSSQQPLQSRTPSLLARQLQAEPNHCPDRAAGFVP
jgi:IS1 family transposase